MISAWFAGFSRGLSFAFNPLSSVRTRLEFCFVIELRQVKNAERNLQGGTRFSIALNRQVCHVYETLAQSLESVSTLFLYS